MDSQFDKIFKLFPPNEQLRKKECSKKVIANLLSYIYV